MRNGGENCFRATDPNYRTVLLFNARAVLTLSESATLVSLEQTYKWRHCSRRVKKTSRRIHEATQIMKTLDKITNIAVIIGVVAFLVVVGHNELTRSKLVNSLPGEVVVGKTVSLPGLQLPTNTNSLILALSTTCHFCKDSLPFYRDLSTRAQGHLNLVAVLPQPVNESQKYLHDAEISTNQVVSAQLDKVGVLGTPTLLLVDGKGKVQKVWRGLLDQKGQQDVFLQALGQSNSANTISSLLKSIQ